MRINRPHPERTVNFGNADGITRLALLEQAIEKDRTVTFLYDGKIRVVEVHALGTSTKDGSLVMRGYQVAGVASRPLPQWTLFSVAKIDSLDLNFDKVSQAPREGYAQRDQQMHTIIAEIAL